MMFKEVAVFSAVLFFLVSCSSYIIDPWQEEQPYDNMGILINGTIHIKEITPFYNYYHCVTRLDDHDSLYVAYDVVTLKVDKEKQACSYLELFIPMKECQLGMPMDASQVRIMLDRQYTMSDVEVVVDDIDVNRLVNGHFSFDGTVHEDMIVKGCDGRFTAHVNDAKFDRYRIK